MPNPLVLPIGPGLSFKVAGVVSKVSDHNRSEISIAPGRIENKKRMADGTLRTFVVATKRKFKTSWTMLPRDNIQTADGFMGSKELISFYNSQLGSFQIVLTYGDNTTEEITVMFDSFDAQIVKRSTYTDMYDIDLSLEEV